VRSDDCGANPAIPQTFGPPGHRYVEPKSHQKLPGFSFSAPKSSSEKRKKNSSSRVLGAGNEGSKNGRDSVSMSSDKVNIHGPPAWPAQDHGEPVLMPTPVKTKNFSMAAVVDSNDELLSVSSISNSRTSYQRTPGSSVGSYRNPKPRKSSHSVSSVSTNSGSSTGLPFAKKIQAFVVQAPPMLDLPMARSDFDWLISETIRECADDDVMSDSSSTRPEYFSSPDDIRAGITSLRSIFASMAALKEHINNDRAMLNPQLSHEMMFFPIQNINSDVVYNGRLVIKQENSKWQQVTEDSLGIIDRKLRVLFEKRERSKQLRNRIAEVDKKIVAASTVQIEYFDRLTEAKLHASEEARTAAFEIIAAQHQRHVEDIAKRNKATIERVKTSNDISTEPVVEENSQVSETEFVPQPASYRANPTAYDSGSVHDTLYGLSPTEASKAFKVLDEMLTAEVVASMPLNSYLQLMLARGKLRADVLEANATDRAISNFEPDLGRVRIDSVDSVSSASRPRRAPPPPPPSLSTGSSIMTPPVPKRKPPPRPGDNQH
jgi:hypothetical protein